MKPLLQPNLKVRMFHDLPKTSDVELHRYDVSGTARLQCEVSNSLHGGLQFARDTYPAPSRNRPFAVSRALCRRELRSGRSLEVFAQRTSDASSARSAYRLHGMAGNAFGQPRQLLGSASTKVSRFASRKQISPNVLVRANKFGVECSKPVR